MAMIIVPVHQTSASDESLLISSWSEKSLSFKIREEWVCVLNLPSSDLRQMISTLSLNLLMFKKVIDSFHGSP